MLPMDLRARLRDAPVTFLVAVLALTATCWWWADYDHVSNLLSSAYSVAVPLGLITSTLLHVDPLHLILNLYWLWALGSQSEVAFGTFRTVALLLFLGLGSGAAEYALLEGGVGLSGVGYGLFGLLWVLSRHDRRFWMPRTVVQLFVIWFFVCIILTIGEIYPVANVAHGAGAGLGVLTGWAIGLPETRRSTTAGVAVLSLVFLLGATVWRQFINLSGTAARDRAHWLAYEGYRVLENDCRRAIELYREAIALHEGEPDWWHNLGVAYQRCSRPADALAAYEQALALAPEDSERCSAVHDLKAWMAYEARERGELSKSARLYREAAQADASIAETWYSLAIVCNELGNDAEALDAAGRAVGLDQESPHYQALLNALSDAMSRQTEP